MARHAQGDLTGSLFGQILWRTGRG